MRTKHLLTAMMLPALFAACTNDDFESLNQSVPSVDGRALVGNVTLNVNAGVDTRLASDGKNYTWEVGDEIGACLMDELTANPPSQYHAWGTTWSDWFTLTDYIQTNYKFTRGEGENAEWTTEAKLCEGNYFFAYPYDANQGLRTAYAFSAAAQVLEGTDNASLLKAYTKNNAFVGYGKVVAGDAEGESVAVDMIPVFGSTGFTIENTGTQSYTIERIVLRGKKVSNVAVVDPTSCDNTKQYGPNVNETSSTYFNVAQYTEDVTEEYRVKSGGLYDAEWPGLPANNYDATAALRDVLDYSNVAGTAEEKIEVVIKGGKTIGSNQSINLIAMVAPVENIAASDLTNNTDLVVLDIYTDKGTIRNIQLNHRYTANDQNNDGTTNVLTDIALDKLGAGNKVVVTFDDTSLDVPQEMNVGNEADLANLIHWNAGTAAPITANLTADVHITKAMYEELAGSVITKATLVKASNNSNPTCNVIIDADVADGALDEFTFGNGITGVTVKGTQSMTKKACEAPVIVDAGATLNITKDVTLAKNITNNGTLNVNANVKGTSIEVQNNAAMSVAAGKSIAEGVKIINGLSVYIPGTITNAGTIVKLANDFGTVTNTGVIGEEKSVNDLDISYNKGVINNDGKVFLAWNNGDIYANGTSTTRIKENAQSSVDGNLIITDLEEDGNILTGNTMGNIVQEITKDANTDAVDTRANTLWLSAALKVEKTDKDGNYVEVNFASGENLKNGAITLVATGANARIDGNEQIIRFDAIEINKDATLTINKVTVAIAAATNVIMKGEKDHEATLSINSNARLGVTSSAAAIQIQGGATYNNLDNNSSSTKISFQ